MTPLGQSSNGGATIGVDIQHREMAGSEGRLSGSMWPGQLETFSVVAVLAIPLLYPNSDPAGMIPNFAFGGVPSATGLLGSTIGSNTA